jgi:hypothetical protein
MFIKKPFIVYLCLGQLNKPMFKKVFTLLLFVTLASVSFGKPTKTSLKSKFLAPLLFRDADGDGYGNPSQPFISGSTVGYVNNSNDCDDTNAQINPTTSWYLDADHDGYATGSPITACIRPTNRYLASELTAISGDCNDANSAINPGATEVCDGVDNNCNSSTDEGFELLTFYQDNDDDGFGDPEVVITSCFQPELTSVNNTDCDDSNPSIQGPSTVWFKDADGDGYSDGTDQTACTQPEHYFLAAELTSTTGDCDDENPAINPGATEICDDIDNDCDGSTDEEAGSTYYADADGDGYGNALVSTVACTQPVGYVLNNEDCNDGNAAIKIGATEICNNGIDDNCNGFTDEGCATTKLSMTFCGITVNALSKYLAAQTVAGATDYQFEVKNTALSYLQEYATGSSSNIFRLSFVTGIQNFTTYQIRVKVKTGGVWGSYGIACNVTTNLLTKLTNSSCSATLTSPTQAMSATAITSATNYRFQVTNAGLGYSQTYTSTTASTSFRMSFLTGILNGRTYSIQVGAKLNGVWTNYGAVCNVTTAYPIPTTTQLIPGDCNSTITSPSQTITATSVTDAEKYRFKLENAGLSYSQIFETSSNSPTFTLNDFSGIIDGESYQVTVASGQGTIWSNYGTACSIAVDYTYYDWYRDVDGDGYSDGSSLNDYLQPTDYYLAADLTDTDGDCDDNNPAINPGATEICDGIDNDCDLEIDEGVLQTYYYDNDGDGYGDAGISETGCSPPSGYVNNDDDFDDFNDQINPEAIEICDGIDNNCNGQTDEGLLTTYYADRDGDTYGDPGNTTQACSLPDGYVSNDEDCNDDNEEINPNSIWYKDQDGDGYSDGSSQTQCNPGLGYVPFSSLVSDDLDCDDSNENINPAATEVCDGIDNNCDGQTDEGVLTTYYLDSDDDGYGDPAHTTQACSAPTGYVDNDEDCNDSNDELNPTTLWYYDEDGDGYGDGSTTTGICAETSVLFLASSLISTTADCNDNNANIHPGATEVCNGFDDDCDGQTDEGLLTTYYQDNDGDGYGNPSSTTQACSSPSGYVSNQTDCNDNNDLVNPSTTWYLDADGDGYGTNSTTVVGCTAPGNYVLNNGDLDDNNDAISPGLTELCNNGIDDDSDGSVDEYCQTTRLNTSYCGITLPAVESFMSCQAVPGAERYRYLVEDGLGFVGTYESSTNSTNFRMSFVSPNVSFSTTYTVKVAIRVDNIWGPYGPACFVTTPEIPTSNLTLEYCNTTIFKPSTEIEFKPVFSATSYSIELSNFDLSYSQTFTTGSPTTEFSLSSFTGLVNGEIYVVRIAAETAAGLGEYGDPCNLTVEYQTQLDAEFCNITLDLFGRKLKCDGVPGATSYQYRMTGPNGYDQTWSSPDNSIYFKLPFFDALSPISPSTTYNISVSVEMNGGYGSYGTVCSVTTPAIPTTALTELSCNSTISSPNAKIYYTTVPCADSYIVELTSVSPAYSETYTVASPLNYFTLSSFPNLSNGTTYSVRIAAVMDGVTADWGSPCNITVDYKTRLTPTYCDFTLSTIGQKIRCTAIAGASNYRYKVTGPNGYDQTWVSPNNTVFFRMSYVNALSPLEPGTTYSVEIAVDFNGGTGSYGDPCSITTPPVFRLDEEELSDNNSEMAAYPNPFSQAINIELGVEKIPAKVTLRDLSGRILFVTTTENQQLVIGEALSKGIYLLSIEKGELRKETKIIKE